MLVLKNKCLAVLALVLILSGCFPGKLSPEKYKEWYRSDRDRLTIRSESGNVTYEIMYMTPEILALSDPDLYDGVSLDELVSRYSGLIHFRVRVKGDKSPDSNSEAGRREFILINGNNELMPAAIHTEGGMSAGKDKTYYVAFERITDDLKKPEFIIDEYQRRVSLKFSDLVQNHLPKLNL